MPSERLIGVPNKETGELRDGRWVALADHITLQPAIPEWDDRAEDWVELFDALSDLGFEVQIPEHKTIPSGSDLPEFIPTAFIVYIGYKVTDALIGMLVEELTAKIVNRVGSKFWKKGEKAKGIIYGPDGEVLKEITYAPKRTDEEKGGAPKDVGSGP